jgi:pimeloyl-ACP methyl ester carboxylesterase
MSTKTQTSRRPAGAVDKLFVEINGAKQGMFITRSDRALPVLLYLHGGMPEYFLERKYRSGLEQFFTVVWWEQRGSGISYQPRAPQHLVTVDQLIDDTLGLGDHLRRRFDQPRIYLMGHSGGTFIGIQAVARAPELFHAYIGVAQISDQLESETLAYRYMLAECRKRGYPRLARRLERCPVTEELGAPAAYMRVRDVAMHRLGVGTVRSMTSLVSGILLPSLLCGDYTVGERLKLWAAKARSGASVVWDAMLATDLRQQVTEVGVPVYFLHGVHDYTCSYALARTYFQELAAPTKGFYTFPNSAHSPIFEEPYRTLRIVREDILHGSTSLADDATADREVGAGRTG